MPLKMVDAFDAKGKPKKAKLRYSNYWITIVSNMKDSPDVREKTKKIVDEVFDDDKIAGFMRGDVATVIDVDAQGGFEVSTKNHYPHAHILVKIRHRGKVQLDYDKIIKRANAVLGHEEGKSVRFDAKLVPPDPSLNFIEYATKHGRTKAGAPFQGEIFD